MHAIAKASAAAVLIIGGPALLSPDITDDKTTAAEALNPVQLDTAAAADYDSFGDVFYNTSDTYWRIVDRTHPSLGGVPVWREYKVVRIIGAPVWTYATGNYHIGHGYP